MARKAWWGDREKIRSSRSWKAAQPGNKPHTPPQCLKLQKTTVTVSRQQPAHSSSGRGKGGGRREQGVRGNSDRRRSLCKVIKTEEKAVYSND